MFLGIAAVCGLVAAGLLYMYIGALWVLPAAFLAAFLLAALVIFGIVWVSCKLVKTDGPSTDSPYYRWLLVNVAQAIPPILLMRVKKEGMEKAPKDGRFLLVCNHLEDLDPVCLAAAFPKSHLAFISKRENTNMFLVGKIMHKTLCQLINRENDREALKTILSCISIIKEDKASVAVFPEGYTSTDGLLHPFRHGVFKIAQKANVPIVVCAIKNTNKVFYNAKHLKPTTVTLALLDVLQPQDFAGKTAVDIGTQVHKLMADYLGPDLVLPEGE